MRGRAVFSWSLSKNFEALNWPLMVSRTEHLSPQRSDNRNFRSVGQFGSRWHFGIARLLSTAGLSRPYVVTPLQIYDSWYAAPM